MKIEVRRVEYQEVENLRDLYRQEANCQIISDSLLRRGLADAYLLVVDGRVAGYGAVRNRYGPGQLTEFYTLPAVRSEALTLFRDMLTVSGATHIQAQTNLPLLLTLLYDYATNITEESTLFQDAFTTNLACPIGSFRSIASGEADSIFPHTREPVGDWGIEADGNIVATGGFLCHYNPPYGDVYMEVAGSSRQQGVGSYLVQEVKRVCYESGKRPAARCSPDNIASRRTLQKAGFLPCGRLLVGEIKPSI